MQHAGTHKKQAAGAIRVLSFFITAFFLIAVSGLVTASHAGSNKVSDHKHAISERNLKRWENMSESQKNRFRKLHKQYLSMPAEKRALLKKKMETFNGLPRNVQRIIQNNSKRLKSLSENDRRSFYKLIRKYQNLPPRKRALVNKAFKRVRTLPKTKQLELFHLLIEENRKSKPALGKVIKNFLIKAGLADSAKSKKNRP